MKKMIAAALAAFALTACVSEQPQGKDPSQMTKCEAVGELLANTYATPGQQAAAMEVGRNHGCFGTAQEQRLKVTVQ